MKLFDDDIHEIGPAGGAVFSACWKYRYLLYRTWDDGSSIAFAGLNPSTADHEENDNTIRRCISFAKDWGYGGLYMLNAAGLRSREPRSLKHHDDPCGPHNADYLRHYTGAADETIVCWGDSCKHLSPAVMNQACLFIGEPCYCLGLTQHGHPRHPLYLAKATKPVKYR